MVSSPSSRPCCSSWRGSRWRLGDAQLLRLGVAADADQLHAVAQRGADGVDHVGGGDEEHVAEVVRHLEVVVAELAVLLGVEHLEQRRRRVAPEVSANLVNFIEHDHRVHRPGLLHRLDDPAGQRADVGAPVAADLRLVADAAQREAHEAAVHGAGDAAPQRGLADAGRPDQAEDRCLQHPRRPGGGLHHGVARRRRDSGLAGGGVGHRGGLGGGVLSERGRAALGAVAHRHPFEDAVLHLGEAVVVLVEDRRGALDVDVLGGALAPGQVEQPVDPGAHHPHLRRGAGDLLEARHLLERARLDVRAAWPAPRCARPGPRCRRPRPRARRAPCAPRAAARAGCARAATC